MTDNFRNYDLDKSDVGPQPNQGEDERPTKLTWLDRFMIAEGERDEARAIARRQLKALKRVRDGWGEPWQPIVCDAIDATEAMPWAKEEG